jgi:predicted phosphodiesterase
LRRLVVISDTQIPYHNRKQVAALVRYIGATQPDEVIHIGDLMDYPQPARWSKDSRAEFEGSILKDSDAGNRFLGSLRDVYPRPIHVHEGNHDLRPRAYLAKYAPALADSDAFTLPVLLDFADFGVALAPDFYEFTPGWVSTHGHLGFSLSRYAGGTAINAAKRIGKSVVMGHTHRAGIVSESTGYAGRVKTLTGVEVGNLMDMSQAHYLKYGAGNWQSAFGLIEIDGRKVTPHIIPVSVEGWFVADGRTWK